MYKKLFNLNLIHLIMFLASTSFAANEYGRPVIFSGAGTPYAHCKIVTIHSLTEAEGRVYSQSGVGWFIRGDQGFHLLTPAHVVSGADALLGECLGRFFPIQLQSRSETLDLALLKPIGDVAPFAYPLIYLKTRAQAMAEFTPAEQNGLKSFHPDHFTKPLESLVPKQIRNSYQLPGEDSLQRITKVRSSDLDITRMGIAHFENGINSLAVETLGIRPGFSGVPLFAHIIKENFSDMDFLINTVSGDGDYSTLFLMGMLTRTEVNGSRSLGISLPMILQALPYLMNSQNPNSDAYTQGVGLRLRLQYVNTLKNKVMERSQQLVDDMIGGSRKVYTEICEDESIESSEWSANSLGSSQSLSKLIQQYKNSSNDSQKRPQLESISVQYKAHARDLRSVQQKSGGGDYGEGGGSSSALKNGQLLTPDPSVYYRGGYDTLTAYKLNKPCNKVALKDNLGNTYDSLQVQGRLKRATSLADAFDALSKGGHLTTSSSASLCADLNLFTTEGTKSRFEIPNGKSLIHRRVEGTVVASSIRSDYEPRGKVHCSIENSVSGPLRKIDLQLNLNEIKVQVSLGDLKNPRGFIQLENPSCAVQLNTQNYSMANRWKHQIRSPMMDVDINLNTEGRVLSIKVLRASEVCAPENTSVLWMQEVHFYDEESMARKYIWWKRANYERRKNGISE